MAVQGGDQHQLVYATLLLSDSYLPGALVLAHSLRDAGTAHQLAVLVTLDTVSAEVITQLKTVYDHVIPVPRLRNERPANLYLMNRADLHSAFTKINLWKQTQFSKIVYIDADVVAYRAPDELFSIPHPFSAAPDIGWPDLFNSGVMVLTPNMGDYYALVAMAERGISFDGADQGLLNMHFGNNYNRISFTYNVTPSAHYQYLPAYRHFQSSINMVHFIGSDKPWSKGRDTHKGDSPFDQMFGRWWAVYDRHYRAPEQDSFSLTPNRSQGLHVTSQPTVSPLVQYFTKGEYQPKSDQTVPAGEQKHSAYNEGHGTVHHESQGQGSLERHFPHRHHEPHERHQDHWEDGSSPTEPSSRLAPSPSSPSVLIDTPGTHTEARPEQNLAGTEREPPAPPVIPPEEKPEPRPIPLNTWDAQWQPPPADSQPEALNFPHQVYTMSQDPAPFVPPPRYPSPPKDMWYEVPKEKPAPPSQKPRAIFPWESNQPRPARVFTDLPAESEAEKPEATPTGEHQRTISGQRDAEYIDTEASTAEQKSEPVTPATPTINVIPSDPWNTFTRTNAWDEMPEIERYVEGLQKHRRVKSQGSPGIASINKKAKQERGFRLTDFPSEVDRPSLPVTPAPIRRPKFWGGGDPGAGEGEDEEVLPVAEGVPLQSAWDPAEQLQKLAKQQSEALLKRLGQGDGTEGLGREIPTRSLPFGSEGVVSNAHGAQQSSNVVLSPQPVKGGTTASIMRSMGAEQDAATTHRDISMEPLTTGLSIEEPSYSGPGATWEKGGDAPVRETPLLPTDEELDVLNS
ncbi:glycogenin glucosyltransferase [Verticillium nonalfalfae]|uniref:glycogenin glucosyltransferase n=1 Tax=Verticillium nonalfalfae TaxID=1051616 RepID=A0A3M9Y3T7_9PEZI|nr:glycogenin glucosyltransferase [Verticillium nonalfalfae]RNJ54941.1 glycogenin glucosyltransferase [Verticillium nonalfalfae]